MGAVFINYRRDDADGQARALFNELSAIIGKEAVFIDVDDIALGRDFRQVLQERLASSDLMLSLIGPDWLKSRDSDGKRRINKTGDYVRQEIATALERNIRVAPVLVGGARLPSAKQLPDDLKDLAYRQGFELRHTHWNSDVAEMVKRLGLSKPTTVGTPPDPADPAGAAAGDWENAFHWTDRIVTRVFQPQTASETVIEKIAATALRGFAGVVQLDGRLLLTNQRVLFEVGSLNVFNLPFRIHNWLIKGRHFLSAAGPAIVSAPVAMPLSEIESVAPSRWRSMITIRCRSGAEHRFVVARKKLIVAKIEACRNDLRASVNT
jgi:hypothetical protein